MKNVFVSLIVSGAMALAVAPFAHADAVTDWNAFAEAAVKTPLLPPGTQARALAIVHASMFDAVNGIARKYQPYHVVGDAPPGAREEAAAIQAAYTALAGLFPNQKATFDQHLAHSLAAIAGIEGSSESIARGREWGESVANAILAWRATDGFTTVLTYNGSTAAGYWRHIPFGASPTAGLNYTVTASFVIPDFNAYDPGPPYGIADRNAMLASAAYAADVNEVKSLGSNNSATRNSDQTALALFIHAMDPADLNRLLRSVVPAHAKLVDNARAFALYNLAAIDANLALFRTKYKYGLWRPIQAIRYADEDGNAATTAELSWAPLWTTPSHPEYLAGHPTSTASYMAVAAALFGNDRPIDVTIAGIPGIPGTTRTFASFSALADATVLGRIYLGVHYRQSCEVGREIGEIIAEYVLTHALLPVTGRR